MFDTIIAGGTLYDGLGGDPFPADLGMKDDRITAIGDLGTANAANRIDAAGKAVAPGFIDPHSHADLSLLTSPEAEQKLRQGVTTELVGQCGLGVAPVNPSSVDAWRRVLASVLGERPSQWPWPTFAAYLEDLQRARPAVNVAALATHGALRAAVVGLEDRHPTPAEVGEMGRLLEEALDNGAVGLSTGLVYLPCLFAERDELVDLYRRVGARGRVMAVHVRTQADGVVDALEEALGVAAEARVALQVSHLCAVGRRNWGKPIRMLEAIDAARSRDQDVTYDQHPYDAGSTTLTQVLPAWVVAGGNEAMIARLKDAEVRRRIAREIASNAPSTDARTPWQNYVGLVGWENIVITAVGGEQNRRYLGYSVAEIAGERGVDPMEAALDLLVAERGQVAMVILNAYGAGDLAAIMRHEAGMVGSDSIYTGTPHPRLYGTFPRVLGRFAREDGVISLQEAVRRITSAPAQRLGLSDRGMLRENKVADVVVFDPDTVRDCATYRDPRQFPVGIEYVFVNGQLAVAQGQLTGTRAGMVLRA